MTIEEFIEARIAEDEDIAAGAERGPRRDWAEDYGREFLVVSRVEAGIPECDVRSTAESQHIARHDPARVLQQCTALRHIVQQYRLLAHPWKPNSGASWPEGFVGALEFNVRALAAIWSDHPDYDPSWAVDGGGSKP